MSTAADLPQLTIGIDASSILNRSGGVGWHTYCLLNAMLAQQNSNIRFIGYLPPGSLPNASLPPSRPKTIHWKMAGRLLMRWRGILDGLDLYHGPNFKLRTEGRCGGVVTIHDVWLDRHPEYSKKLFGQAASRRRTRRAVWKARRVITVSQFSAREIAAVYELPLERIVVIPNGVNEDFAPVSDDHAMTLLARKLQLPTKHFILFVGGADRRKNHVAVLQAAALFRRQHKDTTLLLIGNPTHRYGDFRDTVRRLGLEGAVIYPGRVSQVDLRLLYSYTDMLVFPSLYEGFGMPVLEAMACGAPTITSNTSALLEVAGDAALLVNPEDPKEIGEAMSRLKEDHALREALRVKGLTRARRFTWEEAGRRTLQLYRELCAGA